MLVEVKILHLVSLETISAWVELADFTQIQEVTKLNKQMYSEKLGNGSLEKKKLPTKLCMAQKRNSLNVPSFDLGEGINLFLICEEASVFAKLVNDAKEADKNTADRLNG